MTPPTYSLANSAFRLSAYLDADAVYLQLHDCQADFDLAAAPYCYRAVLRQGSTRIHLRALENPHLELQGESLWIRGTLAGLQLTHHLRLPSGARLPAEGDGLMEQISLYNPGDSPVLLEDFTCGLQRRLTDRIGRPLPELQGDRFQAIPFLHRPTDPSGYDNDFTIPDLLHTSGREVRLGEVPVFSEYQGHVPSHKRHSEGWAWRHGAFTFVISKFSQETMEFSLLEIDPEPKAGVFLRFGGAGLMNGEPSALLELQPGQQVTLGETRILALRGDYTQAAYAFRRQLDAHGCRFPAGFNPPVHWNELYDNPEWNLGSPGTPPGRRMTRPQTYTRPLLLEEAAKARQYGCEALYLDPGWDSDFGTFLWGEDWLGERKSFIQQVRQDYGLKLSLHTPLATWMSFDGRSAASWPAQALRMDAHGQLIPGSICLGARQYLDEAEKRLLAHCADGVCYLMFDGNWYNDGCWNPDHGHPVPYTYEAHCQANLHLARRIHARYPQVLIEMHDMISGGSILRYTPVYYKYGLPGSYDENWGFELMWQPMEDILSGRARALYYYNLACNVPVYLHIDLRDDNDHCLVLWWYASTCRHLGLGGTHENPRIAQAQQQAMRRYRRLERFYKHGDFYGLGEEVHVHALPQESSFVVNLFNLSGEEKLVTANVALAELGIQPDQWFISPKSGGFDPARGTFSLQRRLPAWSAQVVEVFALEHGRQQPGA